jgi:hypothetical protein
MFFRQLLMASLAFAFPLAKGSTAEEMHTLYVVPQGTDSTNGNPETQFHSIIEASRHARPGTVIVVRPGNYPGGFTTRASGTSFAPIIYQSAEPRSARIVGGGPTVNNVAWWNRGSYVRIIGFDVDGDGPEASSWRLGIYSTGSNVLIQGNRVHGILRGHAEFAAASASGMGGAGIEIDDADGGRDSIVSGNVVHAIGPEQQKSSLVHGIYAIQPGLITNNVVYDVSGNGITLWHGAGSIRIGHNTIDDARGGGIFIGSGDGGPTSAGVAAGDNITVEHNIVVDSAWGIAEGGLTGIHNRYADNLLWRTKSWTIRLHNGINATGTICADPLFVDQRRHDYRLRSTSPAIGRGARIVGHPD